MRTLVPDGLTRRDLLRAGAAAGALVGLEALAPAQVLENVLAAPAVCGGLNDVEHVVIFINENRSFDTYFGTYRGVRGFADTNVLPLHDGSGLNIFAQPFPAVAGGAPYGGHLRPFHFDTNNGGECINDISHEWVQMHQCWNGGAMDSWVSVHVDPSVNGPRDGINTMGYYERSDLPFYHALADNFTLCDNYFCSLLGPTDPNRCYSMTATIDPAGTHGGPCLQTLTTNRAQQYGKFTWTTYPEQLQAKGITWKVYATPDGNYGDNVLPYFAAYQQNPVLANNALRPTFPADFQADCAAGTLPQVSWVLCSLVQSEHPPAPVTGGEAAASQILSAMTSNPTLWAKSALFITYDENGGFFDHVPPPTAPPGTPGEYLTVNPVPSIAKDSQGHPVLGPIGLGVRVPLLIVSPFSRGGFVCSDTFDHTSLLRFLETRFGPEVPNLTGWRRGVTGDLVTAFNFVARDASVPSLPAASATDPRIVNSDCPTQGPDVGSANFPTVKGYPLPPPPQTQPGQEPGAPRRPSGLICPPGLPAGLTPTPGNPLGLPPTSGCVDTRSFGFHIHRPHGRRVIRVDVYVDGRHLQTARARHGTRGITHVQLSRLPEGDFSLTVVAHTRHGHPVVTVRQYHGCSKGPPHHLHRRRRRAHRRRARSR